MNWLDKPYYSLNAMVQNNFGEKLYKIALDGGMTCPNRDGTLDSRGCIFCSAGGSGDFAGNREQSITQQLDEQIQQLRRKRPVKRFIAYFQAYTNTYAPIDYLTSIFTEAASHPDVAAISIGTRPDCLGPDVIALLASINKQKPVWVELGLQTIHERTARYIRRGYDLDCFEQAVLALRTNNIDVIVHTIIGLPGEDSEAVCQTIRYLNQQPIQGIKLQLLHVLAGTDLARDYQNGCFSVLEQDEYIDTLILALEHLSPQIAIHRLTGDGPKELLIAPTWSSAKRTVLNQLHRQMKERNTWQGRLYHL